MDIAIKNQIYYLEVLVTNVSGTGEEDLDVYYEIFRSDDDVVTISGYLGEVGGGVYKKDVFFPDLGQHRVLYILSPDALPGSYPDTVQGVMVIEKAVDVTVSGIKERTDRIPDYPAPAGEYDVDISALALEVTVSGIKKDVTFIKNVEGGNWEIINNQMIFYDILETEKIIAIFNLFDPDGNPSMENVFKRERI